MGVLLQAAASHLPHRASWAFLSVTAALALAWAFPYLALTAAPLAYAVVWLGLQRAPGWRADYSYGLYLSAYPLQQLLLVLAPGHGWPVSFVLGGGCALACAALLWHRVEKPVLDRKHEVIARLEGRSAPAHAG